MIPEIGSSFAEAWILRSTKGAPIPCSKQRLLKSKKLNPFESSPVKLLRISCNSTKPESPTKTRPTIVVTHITTFQELMYHNFNYFQNFYRHSTPSSSLYNIHLNNKRSNLKRSSSLWRGRATPRFCVQGDVEANHLQMCPPSQIFKCVQWTLLTFISF